jgi:hypothetical protein
MPFTGLLDRGRLYYRYAERQHAGMRLGRNLELDGRSLPFMIENQARAMGRALGNQNWQREITILDQGELGSCTGNAGTGALGTQPYFDAVGQDVLPNPDDGNACEQFAVQLYSDATKVDSGPGSYPPRDTGSSGLAICKVLEARGTISSYRWASTAYGFLRLLQSGPVLQGMDWYEAFFDPDRDGYIDSNRNWRSSGLAGGHEVEALGLELDHDNAFNSTITYANSWGTGWGVDGRFKMRLRTYKQLAHVDLKQYVI